MKLIKKNIYLSTLIVFLSFFVVVFVTADQAQVDIEVVGKGLMIGVPSNITFGEVVAGNIIESNFSDYFWIEDLQGTSTGHYTTIQCDGLYGEGTAAGAIITGVQLSGANVEILEGSSNSTSIYSALSDWTDITTPQLYLYRSDAAGAIDLVNRYGNKPSLKVTIPSGALTGTYKGNIVYTLYNYGIVD